MFIPSAFAVGVGVALHAWRRSVVLDLEIDSIIAVGVTKPLLPTVRTGIGH